MASSCKRNHHHRQHHDGQHLHRCNRFTAIVIFLAVCILTYPPPVLTEEAEFIVNEKEFTTELVTLIPVKRIDAELETTTRQYNENNSTINKPNVESLNIIKKLETTTTQYNENYSTTNKPNVESLNIINNQESVVDFDSTETPNHVEHKSLLSEDNVANMIPPHIEDGADVNNDIFLNVEDSPEIKLSPDFVNSPQEYPITSETLEGSIRNSVKTEIELEQHLETSPVLEILKELPEIRKTLIADMSLDPQHLEEHDMLLQTKEEMFETKKEISEQLNPIPQIINNPIETIPKEVERDSEIQSIRDARNLEEPEPKPNNQYFEEFESSSVSLSESNSSETENSGESTNSKVQEHNQLIRDSSKNVESSLIYSSESSSSLNSGEESISVEVVEQEANENIDQAQSKPQSSKAVEVDLPKPEDINKEISSYEANPQSSDIAIFNDKESEDDAFSVVLNETFSATVLNSEEEKPLSTDEKPKTSLELLTEQEMDDEESTVVPEESEHIVIKKVLDVQEIFDVISETTTIPFEIIDQTTILQPHVDDEPSSVNEDVVEDPIDKEEHIISIQELNNKNSKEDILLSGVEESNNEKTLTTLNTENYTKHENKTENVLVSENSEDKEYFEANSELSNDYKQPTNAKETQINLENVETVQQDVQPEETTTEISDKEIVTNKLQLSNESADDFHFISTTDASMASRIDLDAITTEGIDVTKTFKGYRSVNRELISSRYNDDSAATLFEAYLPRDAGQTFNDNLADESADIGKALPVSTNEGYKRSTVIIVLSSGTAFLFIVISITIFLISFQRQHGTLDIEMQERSCGKDDLGEEDAETFAKLLEVELPPSIAIALDETEECL